MKTRALLFLLAVVAASAVASTTSGSSRSAASPEGHYASVNGLRMYYEDHGRGRPLVLIHGGGSTAQTSFGAVIPRLARSTSRPTPITCPSHFATPIWPRRRTPI
jgi:hypothetical protein